MRFFTRQLLLYIAGLCVWLGVMSWAHFTFGWDGIVVYGVIVGIAVVLSMMLLSRWNKWTISERTMCALAAIIAISGGAFVASNWYGHGYHRLQQMVRDAIVLQDRLYGDPRFGSVLVSYEAPRHYKGTWLWVRGSVSDQESLDALHALIDDEEKWYVEWEVDVVPTKP